MRDFTNPETVEQARAELTVAADPSLVCEFLDRCEALDEDPAYELDEFLSAWIKSKQDAAPVRRTVSTRYGSNPEEAREAFSATPAGRVLDDLLEG